MLLGILLQALSQAAKRGKLNRSCSGDISIGNLPRHLASFGDPHSALCG